MRYYAPAVCHATQPHPRVVSLEGCETLGKLRRPPRLATASVRWMHEKKSLLEEKTRNMHDDGDQVLVEGLDHDPDIIIPMRLSWYLVASAHLLLLNCIVSLVYAVRYQWTALFGVSALCFLLYITSVVHWREPRFSSIARRLDYVAVLSTVTYASYVAATLTQTYIVVWFAGMGVVACVFAVNEYLYYFQVMRRPDGGCSGAFIGCGSGVAAASGGSGKISFDDSAPNSRTLGACGGRLFLQTHQGTEEREWVFRRTMVVHLVCVHVLANGLALAVIVGGETTRE